MNAVLTHYLRLNVDDRFIKIVYDCAFFVEQHISDYFALL